MSESGEIPEEVGIVEATEFRESAAGLYKELEGTLSQLKPFKEEMSRGFLKHPEGSFQANLHND